MVTMANMDGRKQRFEANPMQAQMEAKRKKDEEEAAKKAAAEGELNALGR